MLFSGRTGPRLASTPSAAEAVAHTPGDDPGRRPDELGGVVVTGSHGEGLAEGLSHLLVVPRPQAWRRRPGFADEEREQHRDVAGIGVLFVESQEVLEQFLFQAGINRHIGTDLSTGVEWRPLLSDNIIVVAGVSGLIPGDGLDDLFSEFTSGLDNMFASFVELAATY